MAKTDFKDVDEYINSFEKSDRLILHKMREAVKKAVPKAEEVISYQIPAFKQNGFVIYFSCYTNHMSISFPPPWTVFEKFKEELKEYKMSKSTIQFPKEKVPYELISQMAKFRAGENAKTKKTEKSAK